MFNLSAILGIDIFIILLLIFATIAIFMSRSNHEQTDTAAFNVVIIGCILLLFIYLLLLILSSYKVATFDETQINTLIVTAPFGIGTWFLLLVALVLFFITLGFLIYLMTLIDKSVNKVASEWAIACLITLSVAILLYFLTLYFYYDFNAFIRETDKQRIEDINRETTQLTVQQQMMLPRTTNNVIFS